MPSSALIPSISDRTTETTVAKVTTESLMLSCFTPLRLRLSVSLNNFELKYAIQILTSTVNTRSAIYHGAYRIVWGCRIFTTEPFRSSKLTTNIDTATISAEIYSILPWPKGCSLSSGLLESFVPVRVTTFDAQSERLLTASAVTETAPVSEPSVNLITQSSILHIIPTEALRLLSDMRRAFPLFSRLT